MKLFDSHCHIDDRSYSRDMDDVIKRMNDADVAALMIVGIDKNRSQKSVGLAESHANFYASVGIHPHFAKDCSESAVKSLRRLAESPKVRAWGEIGLDFNRMFSSREDQEKAFVRQLEAADELKLPLIFHERESNGRFLEILKTHYVKRTGVVHCFSGNQREMEEYLELGLYIGVTGILTIKTRGAGLRKLVPLIPEDRVLIETDAPFLTPAPEKNQTRRNEPAFVRSVLFKLAEVRKEDPEHLSQVTWDNACRLFGL